MSYSNTNLLSAAGYKAIEKRIDRYILSIQDNEQDAELCSSSIANLESYLQSFHHHEPGFKNWLYSMMNGAVAAKANDDLTNLWMRYKAASVEAKKVKFRTRNIEGNIPAVSGSQNRTSAVNFNTLHTSDGHTAPRGGNYDASFLNRGRAAQPASVQPQHGSPNSRKSGSSGVFTMDRSGHNSAAGSYHSQTGRFSYPAMQMQPPPPPPPPQQQSQYYAVNPFPPSPADSYGEGRYQGPYQGHYFVGPGPSYPPRSGSWNGQGAQQGQGGPYHQ
ncbi:hypothetical protein C8F04DRAFT_1142005 [Mycena alexandri]|uniref:Uncharacterized protein n=1 Tax=Mycena alexandri TaxID=1745969 RepID=A0AAD6S561_9AGAR|nr:hypothetical protein C8F04DRAFT_1142005 [Mycena alexandri]